MNQKNKICQLTTVHSRFDTRIFEKISCSLQNAGYSVFLLVADGLGNEVVNNVRIIDVGKNSSRLKRFISSSRKVYKESLKLNCDVYHFHDPELFPIALKLKKRGYKVIFDSHEYLPSQILDKEYLSVLFRKVLSFFVRQYFNYNVKKLDAVISVTPHIVDNFKNMDGNAVLITNYPVLNEENISYAYEDYLLREDSVFYAGTIYETSQQYHIVRSLDLIEKIRYSLVGTINSNYLSSINVLPSWEKVDLIPFVPKVELDNIAKNATIGLAIFDYIPNLGYKIGSLGVNKIFEYMLYGLPIICTDFVLWKNIIDKYQCGLYVNPNSIQDISEAIKYLIENKKEAYLMGQNGRNAVLSEFNWKTQEEILLRVYSEL